MKYKTRFLAFRRVKLKWPDIETNTQEIHPKQLLREPAARFPQASCTHCFDVVSSFCFLMEQILADSGLKTRT